MKVFSVLLAVAVLTTPLLAVAMGTYTNLKTVTVGTYTVKFGTNSATSYYSVDTSATVTAASTAFYLEITGTSIATSMPAAMCIAVAVAGPSSTTSDWVGSDVGLYSLTSSGNVASVASVTDSSCKSPTVATKYCTCPGLSTGETNTDWGYNAATTLGSERAIYSSGTLKLEGVRRNAAMDSSGDLAFSATSKVLIGISSAACPTNAADFSLSGTDVGLLDLGASTSTTTTGTNSNSTSFGALAIMSWAFTVLSMLLLN